MSEQKNKLIIALVVAIIGLIATVLGSYLNGRAALRLEEEKQKNALIITAMKKNKEQRMELLNFSLDAGWLIGEEKVQEQIKTYLKNIIRESEHNEVQKLLKVVYEDITNFTNVQVEKTFNKTTTLLNVNFRVEKNTLYLGEIIQGTIQCTVDCYIRIYHIA